MRRQVIHNAHCFVVYHKGDTTRQSKSDQSRSSSLPKHLDTFRLCHVDSTSCHASILVTYTLHPRLDVVERHTRISVISPVSFPLQHDRRGFGSTYTVNTPLPAPATKVAVVPPIFSGQATLNLSLIALNVANLTAELVACLHNTGVQPFHKLNTPSLFTTSDIILGNDCLPRLPPEEAS
jgi:hypothetical protein